MNMFSTPILKKNVRLIPLEFIMMKCATITWLSKDSVLKSDFRWVSKILSSSKVPYMLLAALRMMILPCLKTLKSASIMIMVMKCQWRCDPMRIPIWCFLIPSTIWELISPCSFTLQQLRSLHQYGPSFIHAIYLTLNSNGEKGMNRLLLTEDQVLLQIMTVKWLPTVPVLSIALKLLLYNQICLCETKN